MPFGVSPVSVDRLAIPIPIPMSISSPGGAPTILFGAFDRHNFGDLLFPHIVGRMLARDDVRFAGLAARDLRRYGGHQVAAVAQLTASPGTTSPNIVHVGGELLTCNAWEAAVMLSSAERVQAAIAGESTWKREGTAWALAHLGVPARAPYVCSRHAIARLHARRVVFNAVGGVDLDTAAPALLTEVLDALRAADHVSVRDTHTKALLQKANVDAELAPDPVVMVADLFGNKIRRRASHGEVKQVRNAFPRGYIAVQFSADFGDDRTLDTIARRLESTAVPSGLGVVLFRAGAAPWHDDLRCYARLASRLQRASVKLFYSLNIWDICALIAQSRLYCGSSLHGRIVAMAFGVPRVNVRHPARTGRLTKQAAFAATWERPEQAAVVAIDDIEQACNRALASSQGELNVKARELATCYREAFASVRARLS